MVLISVFDKKSHTYSEPVAFPYLSNALRAYISMFWKEKAGPYTQFPEDYDLYDVGEFDSITGRVAVTDPPHFVESLISLQRQAKKGDES